VHSVIAPPEPPSKSEKHVATLSAPVNAPSTSSSGSSFWNVVASSSLYAQQLLSHFKWPGPLAQQDKERAEKMLREAADLEKEKQASTVPADITTFLAPAAVWELKHIRKLSSLCALTYKMYKVTPKGLMKRHNLDLVTTSWACELQVFEHTKTAEEVVAEGDGMAVSVGEARELYSRSNTSQLSNIVPTSLMSKDLVPSASTAAHGARPAPAVTPTTQTVQANAAWGSPVDVVAAKLADAAAAASAAAVNPLASAAGSLYAGLASLPPLVSALGANIPKPSTLPQAVVVSTLAAAAASEVKANGGMGAATAAKLAVPQAVAGPATAAVSATAAVAAATSSICPSHWFVCDEAATHTRIFVIQGSDTIDHWKLNLTFDPVTFEDPALGVTVHRGVYEAALVLYERFLPLVYEHLESSPFAKVCFTGHSVGGSLATLLLLMFKRRGVLKTSSIASVYTFGAPSVFCEGAGGYCANCVSLDEAQGTPQSKGGKEGKDASSSSNNNNNKNASSSGSSNNNRSSSSSSSSKPLCSSCGGGPSRLMAQLGLQDHHVRNVIMHRDIVPRAFACDYSLVADLLKSWGASFREHCCLSRDGRKHLYYFVGRMMVLQPDQWHSFVNNEPYHPLLPPGPGCFALGEADGHHAIPGPRASLVRMDGIKTSSGMVPSGMPRGSRVPVSLSEAVFEFMDSPHPLETLADPGAYLDKGSISRYHNPDNYTAAIGRIIYWKRKQEPRVQSSSKRLSSSDIDGIPGVLEPLQHTVDMYYHF